MKKTLKYVFIIIILFLLAFIYNNYIIYNSFNPKNIINKPVILTNYKTSGYKKYEHETLNQITEFKASERNAIDIATKKATVKLDVLDCNDKYIFLDIESDYTIDRLNLTVLVETDTNSYLYGANNFFSEKRNILVLRNDNIKNIEVNYSKEIYENMDIDLSNESDIKSIEINSNNDAKYIRNQIIYKNIFAVVSLIVLITALYILKITKKYDKIGKQNIPKMFFILCITSGIMFSLLFPLYQTPDEFTHINKIYDEINSNITYSDIENGYGDTTRIVHDTKEKVNINKYFKFNNKFTIGKLKSIPEINVVKHFPQTLGLILASIVSAPILVAVTIAEIFAVLFYAFVGRKTLKLMPIKKEMMMAIMLLPICIQQIGSFSYDVTLLSLSFLLTSYILNLKFTKKEVTGIDLLKVLVLTLLIAIIKIPYAIIGTLILLVPLKKLNIKIGKLRIDYKFITKYKKIIICILIPLIIIGMIAGLFILKRMYLGKILLASIIYFKSYLPLLFNTLWIYKFGYLKGLASGFGWLEINSSIIFTFFILISIILISFITINNKGKVEKQPFNKKEIIFIYLISAILVYIIILAMFDWTASITGFKNLDKYSISELGNLMGIIPSIGGVQSRYFVPVLPLVLLPIYNFKITSKLSKYNISISLKVYYIIIVVYMFFLILFRFWI